MPNTVVSSSLYSADILTDHLTFPLCTDLSDPGTETADRSIFGSGEIIDVLARSFSAETMVVQPYLIDEISAGKRVSSEQPRVASAALYF